MLYARHRPGLFRFLCGQCGDQTLAEEIFQETWLSLIRHSGEVPPVFFSAWLYRIARNRLIDYWRKSGRQQKNQTSLDEVEYEAFAADEAERPDCQLDLSRDQQRLQAALQELPDDQREVFLLRAHGDMELHEIAELTRTPAETVKSRLRYAVQKLRRLLAQADQYGRTSL